jgi:hypothetical protein
MKRVIITVCGVLVSIPAWAQEPSGCDKFKWPIDQERAVLMSEPIKVDSGATAELNATKPFRVALHHFAEANLPAPPERAPKSADSFAGYVRLGAVPKAGTYLIGLSSGAWLDAIQDGKNLKTIAFSGATDCDGIRKVVKFELHAEPLLLQISGVAADSIIVAIMPSQ